MNFLFRDLNASAASVEDANALLDTLDAIAQTLAVESSKARDLIKLGMSYFSKMDFTDMIFLLFLTMKSTGTFDLQTISKTIKSMTIKFPFYRVTFSSK